METTVEIGPELLGEVRAIPLSMACPECGGVPKTLPTHGERIKCAHCRRFYTFEQSLTATTKNALEKLLDGVFARHGIILEGEIGKFKGFLEGYLKNAFDETREQYSALGRLPSKEELDKRLSANTDKILRSICESSQKLYDGQEKLSVKVDSMRDSVRIRLTDIEKLLGRMVKTYGEDWCKGTAVGMKLCYIDARNRSKSLTVNGVATIGRCEDGYELEIRRNGEVQKLGVSDATVSRKHARIEVQGRRAAIEDLGSKCGTFINGKRIAAHTISTLSNECEIQLGLNTKFTAGLALTDTETTKG
jgi:hypothetical protein